MVFSIAYSNNKSPVLISANVVIIKLYLKKHSTF